VNLIIDIGNTFAKVALFDQETMMGCERVDASKLVAYLNKLVSYGMCERCIVSTVAGMPDGLSGWMDFKGIKLLILDGTTPLPFDSKRYNTTTVGPDRLAAVSGAMLLYPGQNVLAIDAGSCITYELLSAEGEYLGGNIAPGMQMRLRAMNEHTARLPLVSPNGELPIMGHDTHTAMRAGVINGLCYEIEGYIQRLSAQHPELKVVLTGGDATLLHKQITLKTDLQPSLVLHGLNNIIRYNETLS